MGLESMYNSGRIRSGTSSEYSETTSEKSSIFQMMSDIESLQNQKSGLLTALDIIEIGYNDMKEKLEATTNPLVSKDQNLALLPQSNFGTDIHKSLANIVDALEERHETCNLSTPPPAAPAINLDPMSSDDLASTEEDIKPAVGQKRQQLKRKAFQSKAKELRAVKRKTKRAAKVVEPKKGETKKGRDVVYSSKLHRRKEKSSLAVQLASPSAIKTDKIYKMTGKSSENVEQAE
jgi:lysophospholipase L1-like esterase